MERQTLKVGCLAFLDGFNGLVPCKVISISKPDGATPGLPSSSHKVIAEVTETTRGYKKGEQVESNALHVVPRKSVARRKYSTVIMPYSIEVEG